MSIVIGSKPIVQDGLVINYDPSSLVNYVLSEVEVLIVAGGGGGGAYAAGAGGGAGGVVYNTNYKVTPGTSISVTVGQGGNGGVWSSAAPQNGQNSVFGKLTANGGGAGGQGWGANSGSSGGCGGGGAGYDGISSQNYVNAGSGTKGQGFPGGRGKGISTNRGAGGGGGGAGGPGGDATNDGAGNGGRGLPFNISGALRYYAGGGGGGDYGSSSGGNGGLGGGGNQSGGNSSNQVARPGASSSGGGGGGSRSATSDSWNGGNGGSGIVIVRYPGPQKATGGNTITNVGGHTVHTFTSSGTFTPLSAPANSGTVYGLQDLTGNGNNATGTNTSYNVDNQGNINFDGTSSGLQLLHNSYWVLEPSTKYSVSVWFYAESFIATGTGMIWSHQRCSSPTFQLYLDSNGNLQWRISGNSNTLVGGSDDYRLRWIHAVGTFDGVQTMKLYVNSSLVNTGTNSSGWTSYSAGYSQVWIGKRFPCALTDNFNGKIGSFSFYKDKELSQAEVTQNFNALRGRYGI